MKRVLAALALLMGFVLLSVPAEAGIRLCNKMKDGASVAVGYLDGSKGWTARGWWTIAPGDCETLVNGHLGSAYVYLLVDGGKLPPRKSQSGGWFCTDNEGFLTRNNDYADKQHALMCEAAGLKTEQFREAEVNKGEVTLNLTD